MSVEDRLRATTEAVTEAMRPVRPLDLPPNPSDTRAAAKPSRARAPRRWPGWLIPLTAAVAVIAVATTLVAVRDLSAAGSGPRVTPAATSTSTAPLPGGVPRYYVALAYTGSTSAQMKAVVGDDRTGRTIAVLNPTAAQNFYGVTAAADDRTFVVMNYQNATQQTSWYQLRLTPAAAHPTQLTKLPIKPLAAQVMGLALSPDGRELAVMWRTATTATNAVTQLSIYSMLSGVVLDNWRTPGPNSNFLAGNGNGVGLAWADGDRSIAFKWDNTVLRTVNVRMPDGTTKRVRTNVDEPTVRALDVTAAGHDLLADSRLVMQMPAETARTSTLGEQPCASPPVASAGTLICGSADYGDKSGANACSGAPSIASYSMATGKPLEVLYRYQGECLSGQSIVLWTDPAGSHVIAFLLLAVKGEKAAASDKFGVVADGRFTPLPVLVVANGAVDNAGGIAF